MCYVQTKKDEQEVHVPEAKNRETLILSEVQEGFLGGREGGVRAQPDVASHKFHLPPLWSQIVLRATVNGLCYISHPFLPDS